MSHHHHGRHPKRGGGDRDRDRAAGHRQRNGNFNPRKGSSIQEKFSDEEHKEERLKFVEEDFVSKVRRPSDLNSSRKLLFCCIFP